MTQETQPRQHWSPVISPAVAAVLLAAVAVFVLRIIIPDLMPPPEFAMNETKAAASLRTICNAQLLYHTRYKTFGTLPDLHAEHAIGAELSKATAPENAREGYYFKVEPGRDQWSCVALPAEPGRTGRRSFYMSHMAVVHQAKCESPDDPPAGPDSPELE